MEVHDAAQGVVSLILIIVFHAGRRHLSQVGREGAHKGDRYLKRLEEDEEEEEDEGGG